MPLGPPGQYPNSKASPFLVLEIKYCVAMPSMLLVTNLYFKFRDHHSNFFLDTNCGIMLSMDCEY
jgi:hypothetical protein